jgi:hypothetical protein
VPAHPFNKPVFERSLSTMLKFIALGERRNNGTLLRFVKFCKTMTVLPEPSLASYAVAGRGV